MARWLQLGPYMLFEDIYGTSRRDATRVAWHCISRRFFGLIYDYCSDSYCYDGDEGWLSIPAAAAWLAYYYENEDIHIQDVSAIVVVVMLVGSSMGKALDRVDYVLDSLSCVGCLLDIVA